MNVEIADGGSKSDHMLWLQTLVDHCPLAVTSNIMSELLLIIGIILLKVHYCAI